MELWINRFNPRAYKAGRPQQKRAHEAAMPHLRATVSLESKIYETIIFFLDKRA